MSRYVLFPGGMQNAGKQSYFLIPVDGFSQSMKKVTLPANLCPYDWIFLKVDDTERLKKLLIKLSKTEIQRTKDGLVIDNNDSIMIDYNDAMVSSCNNSFSSKFENFYCLLRKHGITF